MSIYIHIIEHLHIIQDNVRSTHTKGNQNRVQNILKATRNIWKDFIDAQNWSTAKEVKTTVYAKYKTTTKANGAMFFVTLYQFFKMIGLPKIQQIQLQNIELETHENGGS